MTEKKYPMIEIMIGGSDTILREMTDREKADYDFISGEQWTPEQVEQMKAKFRGTKMG